MKKMKIGFIADSLIVPAWQYALIDELSLVDFLNLEVIIIILPSSFKKSIKKRLEGFRRLVFNLYIRFDRKFYSIYPNALYKKEIESSFAKIKKLSYSNSNVVEANSIKKDLQSLNLDVLIKLNNQLPISDLVGLTRLGIWSFTFSNTNIKRGGPEGFWEVMQQWPEITTNLQIENKGSNNNNVIYRTSSIADKRSISRGLNSSYWKSISLVKRRLIYIHKYGFESFIESYTRKEIHPFFYYNEFYNIPGNALTLILLARHFLRYLKSKLERLFFFEQWGLYYSIHGDWGGAISRFQKIIPPKDRDWADPFVIYKNNKYYVFIEEIIKSKKKGHISYFELDKEGNYTNPKKIIEKSYHLSYPFVFFLDGEYYMIPETAENRTIELFKCISFPDQWVYHKTLMENIHAVDTTIYFANDKWWLFTNISERDGVSTYDELFLFYSSELMSQQWIPHPSNPIISDAKSARPAGMLLTWKDKLYRPSQNCTNRYGFGIILNLVVTLNKDDYSEIPVSRIEPNWTKQILATHTINHDHSLTIIDAQLKRRRW